MSNYTPPQTHHVDLEFKDPITGSKALNFGAENAENAALEVVINTAFIVEMDAKVHDFNFISLEMSTQFESQISGVAGESTVVNVRLNTAFTATINAVVIDRFCSLESIVQTGFKSNSNARFDINFNRGVFGKNLYLFSGSATVFSNSTELVWSDPYTMAHQNSISFESGLLLSNQVSSNFEFGNSLHHAIRLVHETTLRLNSNSRFAWQVNELIYATNNLVFSESSKLGIQQLFNWVELVRKNKIVNNAHEVAQVFEKCYQFFADQGLEFITIGSIPWDKAKSLHYRKHPIKPWIKPEKVVPEGWNKKSISLNFCCESKENDRYITNLNFEQDKCLLDTKAPKVPKISNGNWWYIVNNVSITNLRTNDEILVISGSYSTDRSQWCWSYNLTVIEPEMSKLQKGDVLQINVNGNIHMMMYEEYSKSQKFADTTYTLKGRSQTALLGSESTPVRSYLQENERTSVQLVQAELDRVNSEAQLNWQLIDALGWIVETESFSYTNLSPIEAIKLIAEAGGGFVYSEKASNTLTIKPLYKKTFWDALSVDDYDRLVPESIVTQHSESFNELLNFNAITLTNPRNGNVGQIRRRNTAGDILLEQASNPLFNVVSMGGYGRSRLAKAGRVEEHDFDLPLVSSVGECIPGEVFAFNGQWWGIVDAVRVSFTYAIVNQSVRVERTVNE